MRVLSYLLVVLFAQSCASVDSIVNHKESITALAANASYEPEPVVVSNSKYYVPKITFDTAITEESANRTIKLINFLVGKDAKAIIIEWNTGGGSVDNGFRLARTIEDTLIPIICVVDGDSASMGMFVLQSCDVRIMTKRSSLMIHESAIEAQIKGHQITWRSYADRLLVIDRSMTEHIAGRMGMDPKILMERIKGGAQWWMSWEEALQVNAVDLVVVSVKQVTESYRNNFTAPSGWVQAK